MMASMRPYTALPRGYRQRRYIFFHHYLNRNKEEGPYKLFILYIRENMHVIPDGMTAEARQKWRSAQSDISILL